MNTFISFWPRAKEIFEEVSKKFDQQWQKRNRVLNTQILVTFLLKLVQSHNKQGYNSNLLQFWESCLDKKVLLPQDTSVAASSLCEARQKLPEDVFVELNRGLLNLWQEYQTIHAWKGYRVFAVDGSRINLPRELIDEGFPLYAQEHGRYYPQGLISCLYNLQDNIIYNFSFKPHMNERLCALEHINLLTDQDIVIFDRGYFSYLLFYTIVKSNTYAIFRMQLGSANKSVLNFVASDKNDHIIEYMPSATVIKDLRQGGHNIDFKALKMRLIKHKTENETNVYATNLLDQKVFPKECFGEIYQKRWSIEELYKISKRFVEIEDFHAKSARGIKQELYAHVLLINLSRFFEFEAEKLVPPSKDKKELNRRVFDPIKMIKINFKNCLQVVSRHLESLMMASLKVIDSLLQKVLYAIARVRQKLRPNRHYPRISFKPASKWSRFRNV